MWVADMDFAVPPAVTEYLKRRIDHGIFGYTKAPPSARSAVVGYLKKQYGWEISPEWLVFLPGLVTGLNVAARSLALERPGIATFVPIYPPFLAAPKDNGRKTVEIPMNYNDNAWTINKNILKEKVDKETGVFFLCNPYNPVGRALSKEELETVAETCIENNTIIVSDEIHCDLVLDEDRKHLPIAALSPEAAENTITFMAPSKTYNIPGLGCSFAVIPNEKLRKQFAPKHPGIVPHVNTLGYAACEGAFREGEEWRQELLAYLRKNRDYVEKAVGDEEGIQMAHVEATYLAWIDVRSLKIEKSAEYFARKGIGLNCGMVFSGEGFVRLNFATPEPLLKDGVERFLKAVRERKEETGYARH
jgi:cystathionine beta-lyase